MPASKKTLRNQKAKSNKEAGIGDADGKCAVQKTANVMAVCTVCKTSIRMVKANDQAKLHVTGKHSGKTFADCFPGFD